MNQLNTLLLCANLIGGQVTAEEARDTKSEIWQIVPHSEACSYKRNKFKDEIGGIIHRWFPQYPETTDHRLMNLADTISNQANQINSTGANCDQKVANLRQRLQEWIDQILLERQGGRRA